MIKFTHTIFYVPDVLTILKFYENAFGIKAKFIHESNSYAELATEGVTLAFASEILADMNFPEGINRNNPKELPQACEICLTTSDPEKFYKKALHAGAIDVSAPKMKPWGQEVAYVRDPSGILVEIAGSIG